MGEWLGLSPYATNRIAALESFAASPAYEAWRPLFAGAAEGDARALRILTLDATEAAGGAGYGRRAVALFIDFIVVQNLVSFVQPIGHSEIAKNLTSEAGTGGMKLMLNTDASTLAALLLYMALLVGLTGRTFGMAVLDLRVVRSDGRRVGIVQAFLRAFCLFVCAAMVVPLFFGSRKRGMIHDFISGTRVVNAGRAAHPAAFDRAAISP